MIEALIERAVHTALSRALEQSFRESGLPPDAAQAMCSQLLAHAPVDEERADAAAAAALDIEDKEDFIANSPAMSVPPAVRTSARTEQGSRAEAATVEELMAWLVPALEDGATWADIARAAGQGHDPDHL